MEHVAEHLDDGLTPYYKDKQGCWDLGMRIRVELIAEYIPPFRQRECNMMTMDSIVYKASVLMDCHVICLNYLSGVRSNRDFDLKQHYLSLKLQKELLGLPVASQVPLSQSLGYQENSWHPDRMPSVNAQQIEQLRPLQSENGAS